MDRKGLENTKVHSLTTEFWACCMKLDLCHPCVACNVKVAPRFLQICGPVVKETKDEV